MVEADYPNSRYKVGQVINATSEDIVAICSKYEKIFRKMHWSEGRDVSEMPKWVESRFLTTPRIYPVEYSLIGGYPFIRVVGDESWLDMETACNDWKLTPATEADYLEYLKSKEK